MPNALEVNFDGLVGPTHNYAGLSTGNIASTSNRATVSNPRQAALQGLEKMRRLTELGLAQAVLPPQSRPYLPVLRQLGFAGRDSDVLARAAAEAPELLTACTSASAMWTANAATVAPSADTIDGLVHFTPANLVSKFHRSIEPPTTARVLKAIFGSESHFVHHDPLPGGATFGDEGAANHTRFCTEYGSRGVELFVYGRHAFGARRPEPRRFPARQTFEASRAIARLHELEAGATVFAQQSPKAIDAGVFHNDVASVGNRDLFFLHEHAFLNREGVLRELKARFRKVCGAELKVLEVKGRFVSLRDAVKSYLFNSQLVSVGDGRTALIAPLECRETRSVRRYLERLLEREGGPLDEVHFLDVRQSMRNGGGPACLRLRVVLTRAERAALTARVMLDDALYTELRQWVERHYRDRLALKDLADPKLLEESNAALDELTRIMKLGSIYDFQR